MNKNIWIKFSLKLHSDFKTKWKLSLVKIYLRICQTKVWLMIQDIQWVIKLKKINVY